MGRRHRLRRVDPDPARPRVRLIGAANPLRHLTGDTASLAALLGTISDPLCWSATPTAAASHASMVSQPEAVKRLILNAVEETSRSQP
jgi:hypothetical protein